MSDIDDGSFYERECDRLATQLDAANDKISELNGELSDKYVEINRLERRISDIEGAISKGIRELQRA